MVSFSIHFKPAAVNSMTSFDAITRVRRQRLLLSWRHTWRHTYMAVGRLTWLHDVLIYSSYINMPSIIYLNANTCVFRIRAFGCLLFASVSCQSMIQKNYKMLFRLTLKIFLSRRCNIYLEAFGLSVNITSSRQKYFQYQPKNHLIILLCHDGLTILASKWIKQW